MPGCRVKTKLITTAALDSSSPFTLGRQIRLTPHQVPSNPHTRYEPGEASWSKEGRRASSNATLNVEQTITSQVGAAPNQNTAAKPVRKGERWAWLRTPAAGNFTLAEL